MRYACPTKKPIKGDSKATRAWRWRSSPNQFEKIPSLSIPHALSTPLACGRFSAAFLQWKDLQDEACKPLVSMLTREASLSLHTSKFKPPTPISLSTLATERTSLVVSPPMTTRPTTPVLIIKRMRMRQYRPPTPPNAENWIHPSELVS